MSSSPGIVSRALWLSGTSLLMWLPKSAFPKSDANLFEWVGTIEGAPGTVSKHRVDASALCSSSRAGTEQRSQVYAGLTFKICIHFPPNYPYVAPSIRFETPCFHPNVDLNGNICLDILQVGWFRSIVLKLANIFRQDKWSAVYSVNTILLSLQSLLGGKSKYLA